LLSTFHENVCSSIVSQDCCKSYLFSLFFPLNAIKNEDIVIIFLILIFSSRGDHFRFGLVFIKKNNQIEFFYIKKPKPNPNQTDRFLFGFLGQKPVQTGLARFFLFDLFFFSVWVRFGFFSFRLIKPNWTDRFFPNFNRFFFTVRFFRLFFFRFSQFFGFFTHSYF
jgi:hypothetical protein